MAHGGLEQLLGRYEFRDGTTPKQHRFGDLAHLSANTSISSTRKNSRDYRREAERYERREQKRAKKTNQRGF